MREILSRFGLKKAPFSKDISVVDFYGPPGLQEARPRLLAALKGRASAVVTGDSGTGKTYLLRSVEKALEGQPYRMEYIHNSTVNRRDFYRQIGAALGLEPKASAASLFRQVSQQIEELASAQKIRPTLLLDEAHMLPPQVLMHLPVLLNYQRDSKPFLSLVLVGLGELRETLRRNLHTALSSRIPVRIHVTPLEPNEVAEYVQHRLEAAGAQQEIFTEESLLLIAEATGGIMRKIDNLAHACLEQAAVGRVKLVDAGCVRDATQVCVEALA